MFQAIWRELRELRTYAVVLICAAALLVFYAALNIFRGPAAPGLTHPLLLGLAALCLTLLFADGAAPDDRAPGGPWRLSNRRRRRDAIIAALVILAVLVLGWNVLGLLEPLQPDSYGESWQQGGNRTTLVYPEIEGLGDVLALAGKVIVSLVVLALELLLLTAPACAALYGLRQAASQSWRVLQSRFFALLGRAMLALLAAIPAGFLVLPAFAYWLAAEDPRYGRTAHDICLRVGPENIPPLAAVATVIFALVLWCYSRATARLIERSRN